MFHRNRSAARSLVALCATLCLLAGLIPAPTRAAARKTATITVETVRAHAGWYVEVPVTLSGNPGIAGAELSIWYDPFVLVLTEVRSGPALADLTLTYSPDLDYIYDTVSLTWNGQDAVTGTEDGTMATLVFALFSSAPEEEYPLKLSLGNAGVYDGDYRDVDVTLNSGAIRPIHTQPGDMNEDGKVDAGDVTLLKRYLAGEAGAALNLSFADVDGDGQANGKDADLLDRFVRGEDGAKLPERCREFLKWGDKKETKVVFSSDVHLLGVDYYSWKSEQRVDHFVSHINDAYDAGRYQRIFFLGDISGDWMNGSNWMGSWLAKGYSDSERIVNEYFSRLKAPYDLMPGNHEAFGEENWHMLTGRNRNFVRRVDDWLIIGCDTFAGSLGGGADTNGGLDADFNNNGENFSPTDLNFVRRTMDAYPDLPVVLASHYFDYSREPAEFYEFLKNEKRITVLVCGHNHNAFTMDLGEKADNVCIFFDGCYCAYTGSAGKYAHASRLELLRGWTEATLTEEGVEMCFVQPAADYRWSRVYFHWDGDPGLGADPHTHGYYPRRDI